MCLELNWKDDRIIEICSSRTYPYLPQRELLESLFARLWSKKHCEEPKGS